MGVPARSGSRSASMERIAAGGKLKPEVMNNLTRGPCGRCMEDWQVMPPPSHPVSSVQSAELS
jgi:hypothetical protein